MQTSAESQGIRPSRPLLDDFRVWVKRERSSMFFRPAALTTLTLGMYLHITSLLVGREVFLERVLTPGFDLGLAVPMTYAAVTGWMVRKRALLSNRLSRTLYLLLCSYFSVSVPIHAQTLVTGRVDFLVRAFPEGYSYFILPVMTMMFGFVYRLRFDSTPSTRAEAPGRAADGGTEVGERHGNHL